MTLQMSSMEMVARGYRRVAIYYNKEGRQITCWQGNGQYIIRFHAFHHSGMWTQVFDSRKDANAYIRRFTVAGVQYAGFRDGLYVHDKKAEAAYGIARETKR